MEFGYQNTILRINLSEVKITQESQSEKFYRTYLGGEGFISYYLLKELEPNTDPIGPNNKLIFATGPLTGIPLAGTGRICIGAKSPLTEGFGASEVGGYLGPELKKAGFDALIIEGKSPNPVYIWIKDKEVKLKEATHLWGQTTGETQEKIKKELQDEYIHVAQIGPGGENLVKYACIISDLRNAAGRGGMGAVMGSKNLKAIVVRGTDKIKIKSSNKLKELRSVFNQHYLKPYQAYFSHGTGGGLMESFCNSGNLPIKNFSEGEFPNAKKIDPQTFEKEVGLKMETCYGCPIRCKKLVGFNGLYNVDPKYGGPEYETLASFGSNCGIDDYRIICKANELCNKYSLDTISTGVTISFAMECFERNIITTEDTNGINLKFGNGEALIEIIERIANRQGFGNLLAEGSKRAAKEIKKNSEQYAMHVKGLEIPMHEPRFKQGLGLGYVINPIGADHMHNLHDTSLLNEQSIKEFQPFGILDPLPLDDLSFQKVRALLYNNYWKAVGNSLIMCYFTPWTPIHQTKILRAITGWNITTWELMKIGERILNLSRIFNLRAGITYEDDKLPLRFHQPTFNGALSESSIDKKNFDSAKKTYYKMIGWDTNGKPIQSKLLELNMEWASKLL